MASFTQEGGSRAYRNDLTGYSSSTMGQICHHSRTSFSFLVRDCGISFALSLMITSAGFKISGIPSIAIACKCDLEKRVSPQEAALAMEQYGCRLIEVSQFTDDGKKRMRRAIDVLVQQIIAMPGEL